MAPVIRALARLPRVEVQICDTGQHREMSAPIMKWFGIRPRYRLGLMTANQTLSGLMARALVELDRLLVKCRPDVVVCQGDTTTAMATALAAFHRRIPVAHVEAGLRTGDRLQPWPEEINRCVVDLVTDYYFAPTAGARDNLLADGVDPRRIWVTGNTAIDALSWTLRKLRSTPLPATAWPQKVRALTNHLTNNSRPVRPFVLITAHRRESFGDGMRNIATALKQLAHGHPDIDWVFPVHLNPNVGDVMRAALDSLPNVTLLEPLGYPQFCWLCARATLLLTDSGGVQEEMPSLGKPVLVMREVTERPEGIDAGVVRLVGASTASIVQHVSGLLTDPRALRRMSRKLDLYGDGRAAARIAGVLTCQPTDFPLAPVRKLGQKTDRHTTPNSRRAEKHTLSLQPLPREQ